MKKKIISLKGPKRKASSKVKELMKQSKTAFYEWKQVGKPKGENSKYIEMKTKKRELRNQIRKEEYLMKQKFYNSLMDNPDSKTFFRLLRKNKNNTEEKALVLKNEEQNEIHSPQDQTNLFASFFEKLATSTPATSNHYDQQYLEECSLRITLIQNLIEQDILKAPTTGFSHQEIREAINQLNTGKSADRHDLTAEHFKHAGDEIIDYIIVLFDNILKTGVIPNIFKTGTITPVHKKGKRSYITNQL